MFESSLIALEEKKHRRRFAPLPIAVGLHLAVLASVGLAQVWNVPGVADPELVPPFIDVHLPSPPPAPASGSPTPPATPTQAPATPQETVQPDAEAIPDAPADPVPTFAADLPFVPGGSPDGHRDGLIGGVTDGIPGGDPEGQTGQGGIGWTGPVVAPQPRNEIVRFDGTMTRPVKLSGRPPRYTELARRAGVQGTVVLEAVIDKKGRVSNVRVLKGLPMGLDAEAVAAVQDWVFEPARMEDRPVAVYYTLTVHFEVLR